MSCASDAIAEHIKNFDQHYIGDRKVDVRTAADKNSSPEHKLRLKLPKVFISGIGEEVSDKDLEIVFEQFGPINKAYAILEPISGRRAAYGYVVFEDRASI